MSTIDEPIYGDPDQTEERSYPISITAILICLALSVLTWTGASDPAAGAFTFVMTVPYFLPAFVADARDHHNRAAIFATNLLVGWTGFGWIFALIWSLTRRPS